MRPVCTLLFAFQGSWHQHEEVVAIVAVRLNETAFEFAKRLISEGEAVFDERDDWSEHQPTAGDGNKFIGEHGMSQYAKWHLGIETKMMMTIRAGTSSRTGILTRLTVVACSLPKAERDSTSTSILKTRRLTYTE
jgi:hypothetical protein